MTAAQTIPVEVTAIERVTPLIKRFTFSAINGAELPPFSSGSHIIVVVETPARTHRNPYSLLSSPRHLHEYEIGVRRMENSRGGSHFLHDEVQVGSRLRIAHPVNLFPLNKVARKHVMLAGGVGITPYLAHLEEVVHGSVPYELHYAVRSAEHAAFAARIESRAGARLQLYLDSGGRQLDIEAVLSVQPLGTHVYACGPPGFTDLAVATARRLGWPASHIHWERFAAPPVGEPFETYLARSRIEVHVPADRSLLETLEAAGIEVPYLCRGGVCGFCRTPVIEVTGTLIHNDHFLSDAEKSAGKSIMPCVSRAQCKTLVLDL